LAAPGKEAEETLQALGWVEQLAEQLVEQGLVAGAEPLLAAEVLLGLEATKQFAE